jgi:hypothetical protein
LNKAGRKGGKHKEATRKERQIKENEELLGTKGEI